MLPDWLLPAWFEQLGLMAWPLFICSLVAIAIVMERMIFVIKIKIQAKKTYQMLYSILAKYQHYPKSLRDEIVANKLNDLQPVYYSGISLLRVIASISPMLGLTGTILGIISAFKVIAAHVGPVTPNVIAEGLWEAMLTTAAGLLIAVPALLFAYLFKHLAKQQLDDFCNRLNHASTSFELSNQSEVESHMASEIQNIAA